MTSKELKKIRERWELTQKEFAKEIGVSLSLVIKWENDLRVIQLSHEKLILLIDKRR